MMSRQEEMVAEIEFGHIINEDKSSHEASITFMKAYAILDSVWRVIGEEGWEPGRPWH